MNPIGMPSLKPTVRFAGISKTSGGDDAELKELAELAGTPLPGQTKAPVPAPAKPAMLSLPKPAATAPAKPVLKTAPKPELTGKAVTKADEKAAKPTIKALPDAELKELSVYFKRKRLAGLAMWMTSTPVLLNTLFNTGKEKKYPRVSIPSQNTAIQTLFKRAQRKKLPEQHKTLLISQLGSFAAADTSKLPEQVKPYAEQLQASAQTIVDMLDKV